jgi:polyphosphate kinase 2 (PPK2 family)
VNLTKRLKVEPGSKVKLSRIDPDFHGTHKSDDETKAELQHNLSRITDLQRKLYADRRHCLLVVLQGIDGAGKDGTCWHVVSAMDPQGVNVVGFKQPTQEDPVARASACTWPWSGGGFQSIPLRGCVGREGPQACP